MIITSRRKKKPPIGSRLFIFILRLSMLFLLRLVNKYILSVLLYSVLLHSVFRKSRVLIFGSLNRQYIYPRWIALTLFLPHYESEVLKFR